jgi:hypothetical protein
MDMQTATQSKKLNLQEIATAFDEWRSTRKVQAPIPERLWALVRRLKSGSRLSYVYSTLRISSKQFHHHVILSKPAAKNKEDSLNPFVELPRAPQEPPLTMTTQKTKKVKKAIVSMEFSRKDGAQLTLNNLSKGQCESLLKLFLKESPSCYK